MYSSRFYCKRLIVGLIIALTPLTLSANLQTQSQQSEGIYLLDDNEEAGTLPLPDMNDYPDFVEQTYPIDEHYGEAKKG
jgi:hypothetical protein